MSNLTDILEGIETILKDNVTGAKAYPYPPDAVNHTPAVLILPTEEPFEDPEQAFGGNTFKLTVLLTVLVASGDPESGWKQLMNMLDPTAAGTSVIKALRDNPTLNSTADSSGVTAVRNVGRKLYGEPPTSFFGADLVLEVYKSVA
mgnify:CR=1 FL=1